jgi:hypothetical protein
MMNIFNSRNNNKLPSVASLSDQATDKKETEKGRDHRLKDCPHAKQKYHHLERRKTVRRRKRSFMVTWFIPNTVFFLTLQFKI